MVGDSDNVVFFIHFPCCSIGVFDFIRQFLGEHVVGLHPLHSFCVVIKGYRGRPCNICYIMIYHVLIERNSLQLPVSLYGQHIHFNAVRDNLVSPGCPHLPDGPVGHGRFMSKAYRKALRFLPVLILHVPVRYNRLIAIYPAADGEGILSNIERIGNILKHRILLIGCTVNYHMGSPDGISTPVQGKIKIAVLRLPKTVPVVLIIVLDKHRNIVLRNSMPVHQDIAVPLAAGKLHSVLLIHLVAFRNLFTGLCEEIVGQ